MSTRHLIPVFGDQLSRKSRLLDEADPARDVFVMAEVRGEILRYQNHRQRVILFLSAMRHFRKFLESKGFRVVYTEISDTNTYADLPGFIQSMIRQYRPESLLMLEAGRYDLELEIRSSADEEGIQCIVLEDRHFLCSREEFRQWADGRSAFVMENFYRTMRRRYGYLMDGDEPEGGTWNYDSRNRQPFGEDGPGDEDLPPGIEDSVVEAVSREVAEFFPQLPGSDGPFYWPVTPEQAQEVLDRFVRRHLEAFGPHQDAMWTRRPFLHHSLLASSLNLKLLDPREVIESAIDAFQDGNAPIESVEGFVRQVLGWREFMRGMYWLTAPQMNTANFFNAAADLPPFYWTGDTKMNCLSEVVTQLLETGYAHHIQRLMVAGLFGLLHGVDPEQVHNWFMAFYVDSVEWVTLPNTVGMSQFADGGQVATKPYIASGKYVDRMSNYCKTCVFDPDVAAGGDACPFTTLYWDFIRRHESFLETNGRTALQVRNYRRKSPAERAAITRRANDVRDLIETNSL